jgi:transposase
MHAIAVTRESATESLAVRVGIDLAKDVFELAFANDSGRIIERKRLGRKAFDACLDNRPPLRVVMEACSSAHHWARRFQRAGHTVVLLPAHDVRPYVRRNKTDRADAAGLLEADRCADIKPVPIKSPDQQGVQGLHRIREHLKAQRTASINLIRGLLREFGIALPCGADKVRPGTLAALEDGDNDLPMGLRHGLHRVLEQIAAVEADMRRIESELDAFARRDARSQRLQAAGGIGLITATALSASVGDFARFPSGRHLACALGLTPKEHSSGHKRRLGRITKRGDTYLRMLLVHGARSALNAARGARQRGQDLDRTQTWVLQLADRVGHNKAAVALANKTVRRLWAAEHHGQAFDPNHRSTHRDH